MTYNDATVVNGNTYAYVVKAVNSVSPSSASNTAQGNPMSTPSNGGTGNSDLLFAGIGIMIVLVIIARAFLYMRSGKKKP